MEILAKKKQGKPWMYIMMIISGVICIILSVVFLIIGFKLAGSKGLLMMLPLIIPFSLGVAIITVNSINILKIQRSPEQITLSGNRIDLGNGYIVNINQITDVDYREARARYSTLSWGTLTVYVENQKLNFYYIENVRHARDRIMQFILQSKLGI